MPKYRLLTGQRRNQKIYFGDAEAHGELSSLLLPFLSPVIPFPFASPPFPSPSPKTQLGESGGAL